MIPNLEEFKLFDDNTPVIIILSQWDTYKDSYDVMWKIGDNSGLRQIKEKLSWCERIFYTYPEKCWKVLPKYDMWNDSYAPEDYHLARWSNYWVKGYSENELKEKLKLYKDNLKTLKDIRFWYDNEISKYEVYTRIYDNYCKEKDKIKIIK